MTPDTTSSVAYQFPLRPALPCIYGPLEYREERDLYERIDAILHTSGIENEYISAAFAQSGRDWAKATANAVNRYALYASIGLRCGIARSLTGLSLRGLTTRAAHSNTLAWFLATADIGRVKSPSKSTVHRLGEQVSEATLRRLNEQLVAAAIAPVQISAEGISQPAGLDTPVCAEKIYFDATCLKALIHLPTDWILLRENEADTALRSPALERIEKQPELSAALKAACGDRGIHSAANEELLKKAGLISGLCPRQPQVLAERLKNEPMLRAGLKRRGATETRIAIFKNVFCQGQLREKSHAHRELAVGRAVLAHNLYVIAKLQAAEQKAANHAAAKARARTNAARSRGQPAAA